MKMRSSLTAFLGLALCLRLQTGHADNWLPVMPEELAMKAEPLAPKAAAIYLYRQVDRDDDVSTVRIYNRIKILTEEGRELANIKIPFDKNRQQVRAIEARTIRPDGSIVEFTGKPYDQVLIKGQGVNTMAKLFTLADAQVGSIIEYRYTLQMDGRYVFDSNWVLNQDLFTRQAKFSLSPNTYYNLHWMWPLGLPEGTKPPEKSSGKIQMEVRNVPAFIEEEYMPPESAVKQRVDFIYLADNMSEKDPQKFWQQYDKVVYRQFEDFVGSASSMRKTVETIVAAEDSQETKARKIYAWVQKLRNRSFERRRSEEEQKRENLQINKSANDLIKHGYGWADEINWLYVALAHTAGLQADAVSIPSRSSSFFSPSHMNPNPLNTYVVRLTLNGSPVFVDPGTRFAPYGVLPWDETMVMGLALNEKTVDWVSTPVLKPVDALVERRANVELKENGVLHGRLVVSYHGLSALTLRLDNRLNDAAERKEWLENIVKSYIPVGIDVALANDPDWDSSSGTMTAEFELTVQGWLQSAGSRGFLPMALFGTEILHAFDGAARTHPIYFRYPYRFEDEVTMTLPHGVKVQSLPPARSEGRDSLIYSLRAEAQGDSLVFRRELQQPYVLLQPQFYSLLRDFFQHVGAGDEQKIVLSKD